MRWLDGIMDSMDMSLRKFQVMFQVKFHPVQVMDRETWNAAVDGVTKSQIQLNNNKISVVYKLPLLRYFVIPAQKD